VSLLIRQQAKHYRLLAKNPRHCKICIALWYIVRGDFRPVITLNLLTVSSFYYLTVYCIANLFQSLN